MRFSIFVICTINSFLCYPSSFINKNSDSCRNHIEINFGGNNCYVLDNFSKFNRDDYSALLTFTSNIKYQFKILPRFCIGVNIGIYEHGLKYKKSNQIYTDKYGSHVYSIKGAAKTGYLSSGLNVKCILFLKRKFDFSLEAQLSYLQAKYYKSTDPRLSYGFPAKSIISLISPIKYAITENFSFCISPSLNVSVKYINYRYDNPSNVYKFRPFSYGMNFGAIFSF